MSDLVPHPSTLSTTSAIAQAFDRLAPGVQRQLWRMGWSHLRPLQVQAIHALLDHEAPVLLSAATAAGKTEAAFLPILSLVTNAPQGSVRVLYVGPLRALINDQFSRLEELCEHLDIPVHRWHGDVGAAAKKKLIERPGGVLLLTPESLESLFINRSTHLSALFRGLQFVVIDELHAFLGTERGRHLQSLLARLEGVCDIPPRRVGLSATLGKDEGADESAVACQFLAPLSPQAVVWIEDNSQKPLGYRVHCYEEVAAEQPADEAWSRERSPRDALPSEKSASEAPHGDPDELGVERLIAADIARHFTGLTSLVFANARGDVEAFADLCRGLMPNEVCVHHGSLSRDIRQDTEELLKESGKRRPVTAFCSSTLELGIDLGDVAAVGQIGAPPTVASLKQRLGRSGRGEDQTRIMRVYLALQEPSPDDDVFDRLHLPLIQTIAATELMLHGWVEPPQLANYDLSTLTQQIMSVIAQTGGAPAEGIYRRLCRDGAFFAVEVPLFTKLLRCLGAQDIIEQTPTGELILGLLGERLRQKRDFYAVFLTPEEYSVLHQGQVLGQLPITWVPPPGEHLLFAGRRWQVTDLEEARRLIHVVPASGKKKPHFRSERAATHSTMRSKMREVLLGNGDFRYLDATATRMLAGARHEASLVGLSREPFLPLGKRHSALLLWTGDQIDVTTHLLLRAAGADIEPSRSVQGVAIVLRHPVQELRALLEQALRLTITAPEVAKLLPEKKRRKYDGFLSDEILEEGLAADWLDLAGARELLSFALGRV